jgi:hypothetical protein
MPISPARISPVTTKKITFVIFSKLNLKYGKNLRAAGPVKNFQLTDIFYPAALF